MPVILSRFILKLKILICFAGKPKLLHFSPYSKDQIVKILTARLSEVCLHLRVLNLCV